jgi:hypothetical protein
MAIKISSEEVKKAFEEMKKDDSENTFLILGYSDDGKELVLVSQGKNGINGAKECLKEDAISFCYVKCLAVDEESKRTKFILVSYIGSKVKVTQRGKVSTHISVLQNYFNPNHLFVQTSNKDELNKDDLAKALNKNTGSHKPKYYDFLDGSDSNNNDSKENNEE